jgi:hypothetical protein
MNSTSGTIGQMWADDQVVVALVMLACIVFLVILGSCLFHPPCSQICRHRLGKAGSHHL